MKTIITILVLCLLRLTGIHSTNAQSSKIHVHSDEPSEGLYVVSDVDDKKFGYCKYDNNRDVYVEVIPEKYDYARNFHNGLAQVKLNGKWGVIDRDEKVVIPFRYYYMHSFGEIYEGLAWVKNNEKEGLIDRTGREIIPVKYDEIGSASFGGMYEPLKDVGLVSVKYNGKLGALTQTGEEVIPIKYDNIGAGKYGMIPVEFNEKWGVLDNKGKVVIPFKYDYAKIEEDVANLIFVRLDNKEGVIDKTGEIIIPIKYDEVRYNTGGLMTVKLNDKWGLLNKQGKEIASPKLENPVSFKNGLAHVKENGRNFYIDRNGVAQRDYVKYFDLKEIRIETQGQYDSNGKKTGEWKEYYKNGQLNEVWHYTNGKKNGIFKKYYENGQLWMYMNKYDNGKRMGQWKSYHENGKPWTFIHLVNDKENGEWVNHYENGKVKAEGNKSNGKKNGVWKYYYENGEIGITGEMENGTKIGEWKFYNEDGSLTQAVDIDIAKGDIIKYIDEVYKKSYKYTTEDGEKITVESIALEGKTLIRKLSDGRVFKTNLENTGDLDIKFIERGGNAFFYISGEENVNFLYEISTIENAKLLKKALENLKWMLNEQ